MKINLLKMSALIFLAITTLLPQSTYAWPVDSKFYGSYVGLSFGAIQQSAKFEDSLIRITVDKDGVHRTQSVGSNRFEVTYSSDWLVNVRDSKTLSPWFPKKILGNSDYLAIRQSPNSELARSILQYMPRFSLSGMASRLINLARNKPFQMDVYEFLGEGMPAPLAIFTKSDTSGKAEKGLLFVYNEMQTEVAKEMSSEASASSWVLPVDVTADLETLESPNVYLQVKKTVIDRAEHNLWTGSPKEIADRVSLFKYAIEQSDDPGLIAYALGKSTLGARVSGMAPIVASAIEASLDRIQTGHKYYNEAAIIDEAVDAAAVQLYEAHKSHTTIARAEQRFGTSDISKIQGATGGKVTADEADLLDDLISIQSQNTDRSYSRQDLENLTAALEKVKTFPLSLPSSGLAAENTERALRDYPNPYTCNLLFED